MNLIEAKEELLAYLKPTFNFNDDELTIHENEETIEITAKIVIKSIDDDILVGFYVHKNNFAAISFQFDRLSKSAHAYELINQFNQKNHLYKAYINENGYLQFNHVLLSIHNREELKESLPNLMEIMSNDENIQLLLPLAELTYEG
jgi:hypothetical protein